MSDLVEPTETTRRVLVSGGETHGTWSLLAVVQQPATSAWPSQGEHGRLALFVLSGQLLVEAAGRRRTVQADELAVLPSDDSWRLINVSRSSARYLLLCLPAEVDFSMLEDNKNRRLGDPGAAADGTVRPHASNQTSPTKNEPFTDSSVRQKMDGGAEDPLAGTVELIGIRIETLAEVGTGNHPVAVMRATLPPSAMIPLHSHDEVESFFLLGGKLDVCVEGVWRRLGVGDHVFIPSRARHAIANRSAEPVTTLCLSDVSLAHFFRQAGDPVGTVPPGPPTHEQLERLFKTAAVFGHILFGPKEQAAVGLSLLTGS